MDSTQNTGAKVINLLRNRTFHKLFGLLVVISTLIGLILFGKHVYDTYQNASLYKKYYDKSQEQLEACKSPKVKAGEDPTILVHYCDELKARFSNI